MLRKFLILLAPDAPEATSGAAPVSAPTEKPASDKLVARNTALESENRELKSKLSQLEKVNQNLTEENGLVKKSVKGLQKENAELTDENSALKADKAQSNADEEIIQRKMAVGLTREQAISSIKRQREFDARKKQEAVATKTASVPAAK